MIGYVGMLIVLTVAFGPGPDEGATTLSTILSMVLPGSWRCSSSSSSSTGRTGRSPG